MATSGRISFTVRSILDLPEQDAHSMKQASDHHHHQHSAEKYSGSPYRGWIETDRNHYPCEYTTDRNSPSPCSYRVFVPRSSGEDAKKRTASACSLQRRGDPGWELYRILLNYKDQAAGGSQPRACERKDFFFFSPRCEQGYGRKLSLGLYPPVSLQLPFSLAPGFLPPVSVLQPSACLYWRGSDPPAARKAARRLPCSAAAAAVDAHALPTAASSRRSAQRCGTYPKPRGRYRCF